MSSVVVLPSPASDKKYNPLAPSYPGAAEAGRGDGPHDRSPEPEGNRAGVGEGARAGSPLPGVALSSLSGHRRLPTL